MGVGIMLVPGTWSWRGYQTAGEWYQPGTAEKPSFSDFLETQGFQVHTKEKPFVWTTRVGGLLFDTCKFLDWDAAGANLARYLDPAVYEVGVVVPEEHRNVLVHSHGLQVALMACAYHNARINVLVSVGSPIRQDLLDVACLARPRINRWLHLYCRGWSDRMQWFGELFDGAIKVQRQAVWMDEGTIVASANVNAELPKGTGHSKILRHPSFWPLWQERGWLSYVKEDL